MSRRSILVFIFTPKNVTVVPLLLLLLLISGPRTLPLISGAVVFAAETIRVGVVLSIRIRYVNLSQRQMSTAGTMRLAMW